MEVWKFIESLESKQEKSKRRKNYGNHWKEKGKMAVSRRNSKKSGERNKK